MSDRSCHATVTAGGPGRVWHEFCPIRHSFRSPTCLLHTRMSEDPLAIAKYARNDHLLISQLTTYREAKTLQQGLKDLLKTRDPWNKEVEFQRKK